MGENSHLIKGHLLYQSVVLYHYPYDFPARTTSWQELSIIQIFEYDKMKQDNSELRELAGELHRNLETERVDC